MEFWNYIAPNETVIRSVRKKILLFALFVLLLSTVAILFGQKRITVSEYKVSFKDSNLLKRPMEKMNQTRSERKNCVAGACCEEL
jgi:hypothetical protein